MRRRVFDHVDPYLAPAWSEAPEPNEQEERMTEDIREAQLEHMTTAGKRLAVHWGHQPWSDSWARLVAETMLTAAVEAPYAGAVASSEKEA